MINQAYISQDIQNYIRKKLFEIEKTNQVKIILAIESGSRAWGFPSIDSDYDVRFIYTRSVKGYLSVQEYVDYIDTPMVFDKTLGVPFDIKGWDLRKALQLSIKSNPVLTEWLASPIVYINSNFSKDLLDFTKKAAYLEIFLYHYDRLAKGVWDQIQADSKQVKTKLYCYALRPVISILWILKYKETPPMDMYALCNGVMNDSELLKEIKCLIERKITLKEDDCVSRSIVLDSLIGSTLQNSVERFNIPIDNFPTLLKSADEIFHRIIQY